MDGLGPFNFFGIEPFNSCVWLNIRDELIILDETTSHAHIVMHAKGGHLIRPISLGGTIQHLQGIFSFFDSNHSCAL